jgi:hypothetical protein
VPLSLLELAPPSGLGLEPLDFESGAAALDSGLDSGADSDFFDSGFSDSDFAAGFEPEFLKSVAYQPLPFSWNPAAVTILENSGAPHFVHTVSGASLTFRRNSCWWPQRAQRYS